MKSSPARLFDLENLFVRGFRASQALFALTLDEHAALSRDDIDALPRLTAQKETMLDDLSQLEKAKFNAMNDLGIEGITRGDALESPRSMPSGSMRLVASLAGVDREVAGRLLHMQEGTLVLMGRVRDFTLVNRALAALALERASCRQSELLSLYYSSLDGGLNGGRVGELVGVSASEPLEISSFSNGQTALPAVFAAIIAARDALNQEDSSTISSAVGNLQSALEGITGGSVINGAAIALHQC